MSRISTMISIIQIHDDGNLKFAVFVGEENNNWKATDDDTLKNQPMWSWRFSLMMKGF